ncbi:MAG TPA: TadE/TadG family type IV pilus assembly protein [Terracidiphilus sp.]|nr:TadE/TadG family type IV pilus assembly protein [Terracidiphilus sp.]
MTFPHFCRFSKRIRNESGQALVETCFSVPFILLVLLGAAELARAAYTAIEVSNAAKAAVQYGAQNTATAADLTGIQSAASNDAANLSSLKTTISTTGICSNGNACTGTAGTCKATDCSTSHIETVLTVNTSTTFNSIIQIPGWSGSFNLQGQAVQKVLNY